ncbi:MAG: NAD(P)H-dependent oxidoreductase [Polyangiaceae bacterium]|nr:NAD(P)H-dependent oxidoreductase [Polyangiaceae bacterium]
MPKLQVIIVSTRPQRTGVPVAHWFVEQARKHAKFEVELVDLKEVDLPLLDEPKHPRFRQYENAHTKAWSARVAPADAFVFVTPEYNYGAPAPLVNALDYLYHEWAYKPAGFVSYGGVSGGTRSVQMAKLIMTTLKIVPIPEAVTIPFVMQGLDDAGQFKGGSNFEQAAAAMLDELHRWADALRLLRPPSQ